MFFEVDIFYIIFFLQTKSCRSRVVERGKTGRRLNRAGVNKHFTYLLKFIFLAIV